MKRPHVAAFTRRHDRSGGMPGRVLAMIKIGRGIKLNAIGEPAFDNRTPSPPWVL